MLYLHVRRTVLEGEKRALANERNLATFQNGSSDMANIDAAARSSENLDMTNPNNATNTGTAASDTNASSLLITTNKPKSQSSSKNSGSRSILRSSDKQWKRVQEVGKQAFLYVGAYFLSFSWMFCINYLDSIDFEYQRGSGKILFPLLVLQAIFTPIFGLFTCLIFFRPKLQAARIKFPDEPIGWVLRQVITGNAAVDERRMRRKSVSGPCGTAGTLNESSRSNHNNNSTHPIQQRERRSCVTHINFAGERIFSNSGSFTWSSRGFVNNKSSDMSLQVINEGIGQEEDKKNEARPRMSPSSSLSKNNNEQASNNDLSVMGDNEVRVMQHNSGSEKQKLWRSNHQE